METRNPLSTLAWLAAAVTITLCAGCNFAPRYKKPAVATAPAYKELTPNSAKQVYGWKTAEPNDSAMRGHWWEIFGDERLNALEAQVTISNQAVAASFANFLAARAVLKQ